VYIPAQEDFMVIFKSYPPARLIGWANTISGTIGGTRPRIEQTGVDQDIATIITRIGRAAFEEAYNEGRAMTEDRYNNFMSDDRHIFTH
jgi:hypothetical protein